MRFLTALTLAGVASSAAADSNPQSAALHVSVRVVGQCALDVRSAGAEAFAPRDLRCGDAMPARIEVGPLQALSTGVEAQSFVVTTVHF